MWTPGDYYRASRAARRAWQARDQQLTLLSDKQESFAGQATSAAPAITNEEQRTGESLGQDRLGLAAERNAGALASSAGGLEDAQPSALRILEPAPPASSPLTGGGLQDGATEPRRALTCARGPDGRPAARTATPPLQPGGVSVAPISYVGPDRTEQEAVRGRGQGGNPTMLARILHPGVRAW